MRILFVGPYPPERDGIGDYTAALGRALLERGHEVGVVAARGAPGAPPEVIGALPAWPRGLDALVAAIGDWSPDVVHVQFAVAAYGARIPALVRLVRALRPVVPRIVLTMHEVTRDTGTLGAGGRALYRRIATLPDVVVVHTRESLDALRGPVGATPAATAVVPHPHPQLPPAETTARELRARHALERRRVLLAFGFIHVDKGLDDLVEALHRLRSQDGAAGDVRLVVAGTVRPRRGVLRLFSLRDRRHLRRVRRLVRRHDLGEHVHFTGYVPAGEIAPWFELADAAVLPYRRIEQSGVAGLAAAAGTPVLPSRVGGLVSDEETARWSYPPRDPARLARVLADFLRRARSAGEPRRSASAAPGELATVAAATEALYGGQPPEPMREAA
jgi:glycosyltransferase involved in cell wall biosynthesis